MNIEIIILDSFPSLEKLISHDDLTIDINNKEFNLRKLTTLKQPTLLKNIQDKITFKILLGVNKKLLGTSILNIQKLKDLFSIDNESYILWIEFKNDNYNKINNNVDEINSFNFWLYYCIRLKIKITHYINVDNILTTENIEKKQIFKNSFIKINNINYYNTQVQSPSSQLNGKNDENEIGVKYKINNMKNIFKLKNNKSITNTPYKTSMINDFKNAKVKNNESNNNIKNSHNKILSIKDGSENLITSVDDYHMTDTNFYPNTSFNKPRQLIKSTSKKTIKSPYSPKFKQKLEHKGNQLMNKNKRFLIPLKKCKKSFSSKKMKEVKVRQNSNNINSNYYDTNTHSSKILNNSRSLKFLNNTINIVNVNNLSKQVNNNLVEKSINNNLLNATEKNKPIINNNNDISINKENEIINIDDLIILDDTNTTNAGCLNKNSKDLENNFSVYESNKSIINMSNEESYFNEYNSLKKDFELLYTNSFINRIQTDLINLEFNLALEKSLALFTAYNSEVQFLFFKNIILKNELIKYTNHMKYLNKKIYKLKYLIDCFERQQKNKFLINESGFHFNEEIKMQKITQKKIMENIIGDQINKKQILKTIIKKVIKGRASILNKIKNNYSNDNFKTPNAKEHFQKYQTGNLRNNRYTERMNKISITGKISSKKNSKIFNKEMNDRSNNINNVSVNSSNINTVSFTAKSRGKFLRTNNGINKIFQKK